jgi:glycosyltransferase involved in cell wall biosynthesis
LLYLKIRSRKIVFYLHNIKPHKSSDRLPNYALSKLLLVIVFFLADRIIYLSKNTCLYFPLLFKIFKKKVYYIPHPNMNKLVGNHEIKFNENRTLKLISFGPITPYKGIDVIIEVMNQLLDYDIELMIVGTCPIDLQRRLNASVNGKNIYFLFQFIPDNDLLALFNQFDICIFPLDINSSLNSSSILLSFSLGKTVLAPNISTLNDFDPNCYFCYQYKSRQDHIYTLKNKILELYKIKNTDSDRFRNLGIFVHNTVSNFNSQENINLLFNNAIICKK